MRRRPSKKNTKWQDHYTRRAKKEHFPARSVYKLKEIQQKYQVIKKGHKVLDLGCAPGSWLGYAAILTGEKGRVVGIDLKPVSGQLPTHTEIIIADVLSLDPKSLQHKFDVVMSDMAPATTGHKDVDAARSYHLCESALGIARCVLVLGGNFICKIFQGPDFQKFADLVKANFNQQKIFKPRSSRKASREIFVIGLGMKYHLQPNEKIGL